MGPCTALQSHVTHSWPCCSKQPWCHCMVTESQIYSWRVTTLSSPDILCSCPGVVSCAEQLGGLWGLCSPPAV